MDGGEDGSGDRYVDAVDAEDKRTETASSSER